MKVIIFVFLLFATHLVFGQSAQKTIETAQQYTQLGQPAKAVALLEAFHLAKPKESSIWAPFVQSYIDNNNFLAADSMVRRMSESGFASPALTLLEARLAHLNENHIYAADLYRRFLREADADNSRRRYVANEIVRCQHAQYVGIPAQQQLVENLGSWVNTSANEIQPVLSPNTDERLYFSSNRAESLGGLRNANGEQDETWGETCFDMFFTDLVNSDWKVPAPIPSQLLNTPRQERVLGFNADGRILYFFRGFNNFSGQILTDTFNEAGQLRLSSAQAELPFQSQFGDQWPFFFNDSVLLFSAIRPEGMGGYDLYVSVLTQGAWSAAQALGGTINSAYDEIAPFLAADGRTLFFSSNQLNALGGHDVFSAEYSDSLRQWLPLVNLGKQVNTSANEIGYRLSSNGEISYFSSDRSGGFGGFDLYTGLQSEVAACQMTFSVPSSFAHVQFFIPERLPSEIGDGQNKLTLTAKSESVRLPTLHFSNDEDLLSPSNLTALQTLAEQMNRHPEMNLILVGHSEYAGTTGFDLYYTIKRLDRLAKELTDRGISANRLLLRSCGSNYPLAQAGGTTATDYVRYNRRIQFLGWQKTGSNLQFDQLPDAIPASVVNAAGLKYMSEQSGLRYRVQIANLRRIYAGTDLSLFNDPLIESYPSLGTYQYTIGNFTNFMEVELFRAKLMQQAEFSAATITATLHGVPLLPDEAQAYTAAYPDLKLFIAHRKSGN